MSILGVVVITAFRMAYYRRRTRRLRQMQLVHPPAGNGAPTAETATSSDSETDQQSSAHALMQAQAAAAAAKLPAIVVQPGGRSTLHFAIKEGTTETQPEENGANEKHGEPSGSGEASSPRAPGEHEAGQRPGPNMGRDVEVQRSPTRTRPPPGHGMGRGRTLRRGTSARARPTFLTVDVETGDEGIEGLHRDPATNGGDVHDDLEHGDIERGMQ